MKSPTQQSEGKYFYKEGVEKEGEKEGEKKEKREQILSYKNNNTIKNMMSLE